jgi:hypothetical protein
MKEIKKLIEDRKIIAKNITHEIGHFEKDNMVFIILSHFSIDEAKRLEKVICGK